MPVRSKFKRKMILKVRRIWNALGTFVSKGTGECSSSFSLLADKSICATGTVRSNRLGKPAPDLKTGKALPKGNCL